MNKPETQSGGSLKPVGSALRTYMFRRAGWWYLMELKDDTEARANAECNVGTVKVEDIYGRQVWPNTEVSERRAAGLPNTNQNANPPFAGPTG